MFWCVFNVFWCIFGVYFNQLKIPKKYTTAIKNTPPAVVDGCGLWLWIWQLASGGGLLIYRYTNGQCRANGQ
jgi:hypothetical protein